MTLKTDVTEGNRAVMTDPAQNDGQPARPGVLLQARGLTIRAGANTSLLSDISFHIEPGELVALTGLSRSGKSSLLQSLAGLARPTSGEILIDGVSLYANLKAFRPTIGFVPAEYALPASFTVGEVMKDAATLRLPRRTSGSDRRQKIQSLLETVGLSQAADVRVGSLGRLEKRKLGVAVELLNSPGLLLLDESAEQFSPFEELQITTLLRELCRAGLTIIYADPRSRGAGLSDQVIFLVPGGQLAWFGPAEDAFTYLRRLVPRGVVKDLFGLKEALEILANPQEQDGTAWAKQFQADSAYQKYVEDPLDNKFPDLLLQTRPLIRLRLRGAAQEKLPPAIVPRAGTLGQLSLFLRRNLRLLTRDKTVLFMLGLPPLIALIEFAISPSLGSDAGRAPLVFGILAFLALLTAAVLFQREISKDRAVYRHESRIGSFGLGYVLSKVVLVGMLAIYQGFVWTLLHFLATGMNAGIPSLLPYGVTLFLLTFIGGILGLIVSALSKTEMTTTGWLLLLTIPQLIFSGAIVPLVNLSLPFQALAGINPSRYAAEALLAISGYQGGLGAIPLGDWTVLAMMSLGLIILLLVIRGKTGSAAP
jgi:ABC-type multidrug transport system ATPase subunit